MENQEIAHIFREISSILEILNDNKFRVLSYERAAQVIESYPYSISDIYLKDKSKLLDIPGVGSGLAQKIEELLLSGQCVYHQKLLKSINRGLLEMLNLRGLGPKKVKLLYDELKIDSLDKLNKAAEQHKIRDLPRMGEKTELDILKSIEDYKRYHLRMSLPLALQTANHYLSYLRQCKIIDKAEYAGSLRRRRETIGDIDILTTGKDHKRIIDYFLKYTEIQSTLASGDTKASVLLKRGIQVDLRVVDTAVFGAALLYFTGSKEHNVLLRERAKKFGLKVNEYGVFKGKKCIGGSTEKEIYKILGLPYVEPELREARGEIDFALEGKLPKLIELDDIKGDLHCHTIWSDGKFVISEMAKNAKERGYSYIAITDHSFSERVANGMSIDRLYKQMEEIDKINKAFTDFTLFKGSEVDIKADGSLDYPDDVLSKLDIVIASVHSRWKLSKEDQTKRIIRALENPFVTILGHPTSRLINEREPIDVDMEQVIAVAEKNGKILEINANPARLDLQDVYAKMAKDKGVRLAINTDAHHYSNFDYMIYGIYTARRGWIEKEDVVNTKLNLEF